MIKLTLPVLSKLGFEKGAIYTTLKNRAPAAGTVIQWRKPKHPF